MTGVQTCALPICFPVTICTRDLETEFGTVKDFFELSAVENTERKLKKLSLEDLENSDLMFIYQQKVAEMLRGDVPFFEVNSSSRDLETEFGTVKDFFELSAVENIERKLKKLSLEDLEYQKKLIIECQK